MHQFLLRSSMRSRFYLQIIFCARKHSSTPLVIQLGDPIHSIWTRSGPMITSLRTRKQLFCPVPQFLYSKLHNPFWNGWDRRRWMAHYRYILLVDALVTVHLQEVIHIHIYKFITLFWRGFQYIALDKNNSRVRQLCRLVITIASNAPPWRLRFAHDMNGSDEQTTVYKPQHAGKAHSCLGIS